MDSDYIKGLEGKEMSFEQFLIGVLLLLLESALIFAWGFYKVIPKQQTKVLPAPTPMLPFVIVGHENTVRVSQRQNGRWISQVLVPAVYA